MGSNGDIANNLVYEGLSENGGTCGGNFNMENDKPMCSFVQVFQEWMVEKTKVFDM